MILSRVCKNEQKSSRGFGEIGYFHTFAFKKL